jgi:hypothetical protein
MHESDLLSFFSLRKQKYVRIVRELALAERNRLAQLPGKEEWRSNGNFNYLFTSVAGKKLCTSHQHRWDLSVTKKIIIHSFI